MKTIEWFERTMFGSYTGSREGIREFLIVRQFLIAKGYSPEKAEEFAAEIWSRVLRAARAGER